MWKQALRALALSLPAVSFAASPVATATVVDGEAWLVRGSTTYALAEGVRLEPDDIVQTPAAARFTRIEFANGSLLDLGPQSQVLMSPKLPATRSRARPLVYLLRGVAKLSAGSGAPALNEALLSPAVDLLTVARDVVVASAPDTSQVFAESGGVTLAERRGSKTQAGQALKTGQFYSHVGDVKPQVTARPSGAFVQRLPKPFLDTLPARAALFKTRDVAPRKVGDVTWVDAQPWVDAEPALRPLFVARWRALAQQPEFRKGLLGNLAAHPEWDRVLFPEKYRPRPPAGDTRRPGASY